MKPKWNVITMRTAPTNIRSCATLGWFRSLLPDEDTSPNSAAVLAPLILLSPQTHTHIFVGFFRKAQEIYEEQLYELRLVVDGSLVPEDNLCNAEKKLCSFAVKGFSKVLGLLHV